MQPGFDPLDQTKAVEIWSINVTTLRQLIAMLILGAPAAAYAQSETIFQPDAKICTPYFGENFKFCKPERKSFPLAPVSSTSLPYLQGLPIESSISFNLFCPSWPKRQTVDLSVARTFLSLTTTDVVSVNELDTTIAYRDLPSTQYVFAFKFGAETRFESKCRMEIISKESLPSKDYLEMVADFLSQGYKSLFSIKTSVESAQELPAKFAALEAGKRNLDSAVNSLTIERNTLEQELNDLPVSEVESREELLSGIENFNSIISDLKSTRDDIGTISEIGEKCKLSDGSVTETVCLSSLNNVVSEIDLEISDKRAEVQAFNSFISAEVERLKASEARLSRELAKFEVKI